MRYLVIIGVLFAALNAQGQPVFKGGQTALYDFLSSKIIYPEYSSQHCIAATIKVSFKLDASGKVNSIKVQNGPGIDLDDEAVRVVKLTSGKWVIPAGYDYNSDIILPIRFTPDYSKCHGADAGNTSVAIANYQRQQDLQDAITNYYKHKYAGTADTTREADIITLKKQLGYDDAFINDLLQQADEKLKQGDTEGACKDWKFIHNIGSDRADAYIAKYCK